MSPLSPWQWLAQQRAAGHDIAVLLEAGSEAGQRLMASVPDERWQLLYQQTDAAYLADHGPACCLIGEAELPLLQPLLQAPGENWGWLASLAPGEMPVWVAHWRARLLLGQPPQQALYRFHDNRVLARGLALAQATLPAYLGQAISVCYWQGETWASADNPLPGAHPVPTHPVWLQAPPPAVDGPIAVANAHRYLYSQHLEAYLKLAEQQPPLPWLQRQLQRGQRWGWHTQKQIEFLLVNSLRSPGFELPEGCEPWLGELPAAHMERLRRHLLV